MKKKKQAKYVPFRCDTIKSKGDRFEGNVSIWWVCLCVCVMGRGQQPLFPEAKWLKDERAVTIVLREARFYLDLDYLLALVVLNKKIAILILFSSLLVMCDTRNINAFFLFVFV